jgi:MYXO-CTERM domain-containing protein
MASGSDGAVATDGGARGDMAGGHPSMHGGCSIVAGSAEATSAASLVALMVAGLLLRRRWRRLALVLVAAASACQPPPGDPVVAAEAPQAITNVYPPIGNCGDLWYTWHSSWGDVQVYSNGACSVTGCSCGGGGTYGLNYQCAELIDRFFIKYIFGGDMGKRIWANAGYDSCNYVKNNLSAFYDVFGPNYIHPGPEPVPGDALEWDDGAGNFHTALVTDNWSDSTGQRWMGAVQENSIWSSTLAWPTRNVEWNGSIFATGWQGTTFGQPGAACWIHAKKNLSGCKPPPSPPPAGLTSALVFDCGDQRRDTSTGDWQPGDLKAECGATQAMTGLSASVTLGTAHAALCDADEGAVFTHASCRAVAFDTGDNRGTTATGDWDVGYNKGECAVGEYVAGVSQAAGGALKSILCCKGAVTHASCAAMKFSAGNARESTASGDWDFGYDKGECGAGRYVAGASQQVGSGQAHAILCCGGEELPADLGGGASDGGTSGGGGGGGSPPGPPDMHHGSGAAGNAHGCSFAGAPMTAPWGVALVVALVLARRRRRG